MNSVHIGMRESDIDRRERLLASRRQVSDVERGILKLIEGDEEAERDQQYLIKRQLVAKSNRNAYLNEQSRKLRRGKNNGKFTRNRSRSNSTSTSSNVSKVL